MRLDSHSLAGRCQSSFFRNLSCLCGCGSLFVMLQSCGARAVLQRGEQLPHSEGAAALSTRMTISRVHAAEPTTARSRETTPPGCPSSRVNLNLLPGEHVSSMATSASHQCAVYRSGRMRCRGLNRYGQLGTASVEEFLGVPAEVIGISGIQQAWLSDFGTVVLLDDRTVRVWGGSVSNLLGATPSLEYCRSGSCSRSPVVVDRLTDVLTMAVTDHGACALRRVDRSVWCWGVTPELTRGLQSAPTRVNAGGEVLDVITVGTSFMLRLVDGSIVSDTENPVTHGVIPVPWEIAPGDSNHLCALLPGGSARCWGDNRDGQVGSGSRIPEEVVPQDVGLSCLRAITRGRRHTCAIRTDGTVWCWGRNVAGEGGQPPEESDGCGQQGRQTACLLRPRQVDGIDDAVGLFLGYSTSCVIRIDRSVWCWGEGSSVPRIRLEWAWH